MSETIQSRLEELSRGEGSFSDWESLLKGADLSSEVGRSVYDHFLSEFPFCFGYWSKYAEQVSKHDGLEAGKQIYEKGLQSIGYSVDLWLKYIKFLVKQEEFVALRDVFERAVTQAGHQPDADKLWKFGLEKLLMHEQSKESLGTLFSKAFAAPAKGLDNIWNLFEKFVDQVKDNPKALIGESDDDLVEGLEGEALLAAIVKKRKELMEKTKEEVAQAEMFEKPLSLESGGRPFFHSDPLDASQLQAWRKYIDEKPSRLVYERCVISCANYAEFWSRYADWLRSSENDLDAAVNVLRRATSISPHNRRPVLHVELARLLEESGDINQARAVLKNVVEQVCPELIQAVIEYAHLERRHGNLEQAQVILQQNVHLDPYVAMQLAKLHQLERKDLDKAIETLQAVVVEQPSNVNVYLYTAQLMMERLHQSQASQTKKKRKPAASKVLEDTDPTRETFATALLATNVSIGDKKRLLQFAYDLCVERGSQISWATYYLGLLRALERNGEEALFDMVAADQVEEKQEDEDEDEKSKDRKRARISRV